MNLTRLETLIGENKVKDIKNLNILVLGLGGVGGYALESIVRSGVEHLTIVDNDIINPSNLNRQIVTNRHNINKYKTKEWKKRIKRINKLAIVNIINDHITEDNILSLFDANYDYIVDACDTTLTKVSLIKECIKRNIKLISCMGTANKTDGSALTISTLDKTEYDPLAKKIRKEIKNKDDMKHVVVVTSTEEVKNKNQLGSTSYVPGIAGLLITNYIINDVINRKED